MLQTSLLLMKSLNKTETPIFLSVVCSLFPKAIFLTFILLYFQNDRIDPVRSLPYFHGDITKDEAVSKLKQGIAIIVMFPLTSHLFQIRVGEK